MDIKDIRVVEKLDIKDIKVGDRVFCLGGGFRMESIILEIKYDDFSDFSKKIWIKDVYSDIKVWVSLSELDFDKSYVRNKLLESLGI